MATLLTKSFKEQIKSIANVFAMKISIVCLKDVWTTVLLLSDLVLVATVSYVHFRSAVSKTASKEKWFAQDGVPKKK